MPKQRTKRSDCNEPANRQKPFQDKGLTHFCVNVMLTK